MVPLFSIVVPVFNVERDLPQCFNGLSNQTFRDFEAILVDDGSNDRSASICSSFAARDNRVRLICQSNCGPNQARNRGISAAIGEYVLFVDADDWIEPSALETLSLALRNGPLDIISFGFEFFDELTGRIIKRSSHPRELIKDGDIIRESLLGMRLSGVCWNKCIRRELILANRLSFVPDSMHARDLLFTRSVSLVAKNCLIVPDILYHSRFRTNSFSRTFGRANVESAIDLVRRHFEVFADQSSIKDFVCFFAGKHLRYILLLSAFRSASYNQFLGDLDAAKGSAYWKFVQPSGKLRQHLRLKDFLIAMLLGSPKLCWLIVGLCKRFGIKPY